MSAAFPGEIAALVGQLAAAEAEIGAAKAALESLHRRMRRNETMLSDALQSLAGRAIADARPDPAAAVTPAVSVVLPVFNRCGTVAGAIRSVLAQNFHAWELIVVDDGSSDAIERAVAPFRADPRIRFVRQTHAGVSAARNRGLALARGELAAYIDSDNYWFPGFLAAATAALAAQPEMDVAYAALVQECEDGARLVFEPFDRGRLLEGNFIDMNVLVHRRRLYDRFGGFDEAMTRAVDWDLILRFTAHRPAVAVPIVGACYRRVPGPCITEDTPLAPNLLAMRRKWWPRPEAPPRVLYAAFQFPQLSESHVYAEIACMRRFGAAVEVWAPEPGAAPFAHDLAVHRGTLADAIRASLPDIVHVHWFSVFEENRAALARADVPVTVRGHCFDATPEALAKALQLPNLRRAYLLPGSASSALPEDKRIRFVAPIFDSTLFAPAARKDRRLVLRASSGLPQNNLRFMLDLAKLLPAHRVVVAITRITGHAEEIAALQAYRAETGSPAEILTDVPRQEMARRFGIAGIYVHTFPAPGAPHPKRLGGPVSIAEAMAAGAYVLVRNLPGLKDYVGDAGATYRDVEGAAALIRATESWSDAQWQAARFRSVERAFSRHADEIVLRPVFEDWCALAAGRAMPAYASAG